jgi:Transposase Tn5 dimerisation domain
MAASSAKSARRMCSSVGAAYGSCRPRSQQGAGVPPLVVWVVHVWEAEPPEGVEPLEWLLLTSVPTETFEQACERVDWYRGRWIVEDYHQGLKTGCRIEGRQLQSYEALRRLLGLLAPAAVRLLQLRVQARQMPEHPASQSLPADVLQVVAAKAGVPAKQLSTQQAWHTIAGFGGYLARKGDGPPGWKTLWKGWFYLQAVLEGLHLAAQLPLDLDST